MSEQNTFRCYYDVTAKVNEIARQHAEGVAPVLRGWSSENVITIDMVLAGLSYFEKDGRYGDLVTNGITHYFRCYNCVEHLDDVAGNIMEWFNDKESLRNVLTALTERFSGIYGKLVVARLYYEPNRCHTIYFNGIDEFGKPWKLHNGKQEESKAVIDLENPVTIEGKGTTTLFLNPADIADAVWDATEKSINSYKVSVKKAFDTRRAEIGTGSSILDAIRKAQKK